MLVCGSVAQLDRAPGFEPGGRGFESLRARQFALQIESALDHDRLDQLKRSHASLRLLAADHMPLIVGFLDTVFVRANRRALAQSELTALLADHLAGLARIEEGRYPKSARQYLDDWSNASPPYLRKYYGAHGDEPLYDLTPATERAIEWLRSLGEREFVGTESRFLSLFDQLRELTIRASGDLAVRIADLEQRRDALERELERARAGELTVLDSTQIRERFYFIEDIARRLLSDFRQVEQNFRALDVQARERLALADVRGTALAEIFDATDSIWSSDQGRSFTAFWEYLLSPQRQAELEQMIQSCYALAEVRTLAPDSFLGHLGENLVSAADLVYQRTQVLVEQLRLLVADRQRLEQRRLLERIRQIEKRALAIKLNPPSDRAFHGIDAVDADIEMPLERSLADPLSRSVFAPVRLNLTQPEIDLAALYAHTLVDEAQLAARIRRALENSPQISLAQLLMRFPLEHGLAELVTYLNLATRADGSIKALIDEARSECIDSDDRRYLLPEILFCR